VQATRADAGSRAGPTRRAASPVPADVATDAAEDAAEHREEGARREAVTATAARLLAGNGGRPAAAGGHGKMAGTMNHGAIDHGTVDHGTVDHGTVDHGTVNRSTINRCTINRSVKAGEHR
jgi:hypothetical protein